MVVLEEDERLHYRQFVELLNTIRSKGLISAKDRREFDKRWWAEQWNRDLLLEEIERLITNHSEQLIQNNIS
jgi:hypothetical protein